MAENSPECLSENDQTEINAEPVDLTKDCNESMIVRRKGKPKKFGNLSEIDIEEKRKIANVQERKRMKKLSKALEDLRKCIPAEYHLSNRKMSKIRTLRLAVNYIASLTEIIERDNLLRQQAYHLESQMLQSTYSYLMPSPIGVQHSVQHGKHQSHQPEFSPYHTPYTSFEHRLTKRHLNFSPFCGTPSPITALDSRQLPYQTPVKQEMTPFKTPDMVARRRTCTVISPLISDIRNSSELNTSFVSPVSEEIDTGLRRFHNAKQYTYIFDGIRPLPQEDNFQGGTDCVYDPKRQVQTSTKE